MRARLVERRRQQDRLIDAAIDALVAREAALAALTSAQAAIDDAMAALTGLGQGGRDLAAILDVPPPELRSRAPGGRPTVAAGTTAAPPRPAIARRGEGAVRLWLAMIDRGPAPKTHGLDRDGGLLCRGAADPDQLDTWQGYAFDVDCHRCAKILADHLTEEEFG